MTEQLERKPRLGFLGTGWIGRMRMQALLDSGVAEAVAIHDPSGECMEAAAELAPTALRCDSYEQLLEQDLDGVVIATPSALHAEQSVQALRRQIAVFCQKPLGRSAAEAAWVVDAAQAADRLLGVDLSYRHVEGMRRIRQLVEDGALGQVYALNLVFHNAYGPDKPWFYDRAQAGGGCVMDLGIHLIDLALWALDFPEIENVSARCFAGGRPLRESPEQVEDYAVARLDFANGASAEIACSWNLPAGQDADIQANLFGTEGGASLRNVDGSFFDFRACRYHGTDCEVLVEPPDDWGGRALVAWARQLADSPAYDPQAQRLVQVAEAIDRIYADAAGGAARAELRPVRRSAAGS